MRNVGIMGMINEPQNHPATKAPIPIKQALPKLFVFSFRKYTHAANDTAT
jgi:hypothetical protein